MPGLDGRDQPGQVRREAGRQALAQRPRPQPAQGSSRAGTSAVTSTFTRGPPRGLSTPRAPAVNGPSRRTHSVSEFQSGQVAMSAQQAKNADGGAVEEA